MNHQPGLLIKCLIRNAELEVDLSDSSGAPLVGVGATRLDGRQRFEAAPHAHGAPISCADVDNVLVSKDGCGVVERYIHRGGGHLAGVGKGHTYLSEQMGARCEPMAKLSSLVAGRAGATAFPGG